MERVQVLPSTASSSVPWGWLAAGVGLGIVGALGITQILKKNSQSQGGNAKELEGKEIQAKFADLDQTQRDYLESMMREQLVRNYQFFGEERQDRIRKAFVIVVGVGGVGSHVVNALVRSGVSKLRIIDFDLVTVSSLNRSAFALRKDVGKFKSQLLREYLLQINPLLELETVEDHSHDFG